MIRLEDYEKKLKELINSDSIQEAEYGVGMLKKLYFMKQQPANTIEHMNVSISREIGRKLLGIMGISLNSSHLEDDFSLFYDWNKDDELILSVSQILAYSYDIRLGYMPMVDKNIISQLYKALEVYIMNVDSSSLHVNVFGGLKTEIDSDIIDFSFSQFEKFEIYGKISTEEKRNKIMELIRKIVLCER